MLQKRSLLASMIGVGADNKLYTRSVMMGEWQPAEGDTCCVISAALRPDGTVLGVGTDNQLYTKRRAAVGEWEGPVPSDFPVLKVEVLPDGRILGVNTNKQLMVRPDLEKGWRLVEGGCCADDVAVMADGKLIGLTQNGGLRIRNVINKGWRFLRAKGPKMAAIAVEPSGRVYGVARDTCSLHTRSEDGVWSTEPLPGAECMIDINAIYDLAPPKFPKEEEAIDSGDE